MDTAGDTPEEAARAALTSVSDRVDALRVQGRDEEAAAVAREGLALAPNDASLRFAFGNVLMKQGKTNDAVAQYMRALALKPDYAEAYLNLGNALSYRGHFGPAISACRQALALRPAFPRALEALLHFKTHSCDWSDIESDTRHLLKVMREAPGEISPFGLLNLAVTAGDQLLCARQRGEKMARERTYLFRHLPPSAPRRIRLGYMSADFRTHPMAQLIVELIERHDRSRFEVSAYSVGPDDDSEMRKRLKRAFDRFIELTPLGNLEAARRIHDDGIDILIDITGYTRYARTRVLVSRPSPIQVNLPGFPGTMGADFIDYIIADPFVAPTDQQAFYLENLVHLPNSYQPNDTGRSIANRTPTRAECGLPPEGFIFCCFNNVYKITPPFFDVWMRLLQATPGSVLWLYEANSAARANLGREAARRGVAPERLVFAPWRPLAEHLARYRLADLFLDTLPYNAHTTASDALWMGVPVLTCAGETYAGRVGGSLLRAVGLPELVTSSLDAYAELGSRLAATPALLADYRCRLAHNRGVMPLFDMAGYARDIETAYDEMWEIWRRGEKPRPIVVAATK